MGKSILTPNQHIVLDLAAEEQHITEWFYFTGGTALSEFHLHHRLSEDLDFFSESELSEGEINFFVQKIARKIGATTSIDRHMGHVAHHLHFHKGEKLKLDFVYQPFKQLEYGIRYKKLRIASLWDITIDKLYTIFNRVAARDFVDLYFAIQEAGCDWEQLMNSLDEKYEAQFNEMSLLSRIPIVKDLRDFPTMLIPFDRKRMEDYFLGEVKKMEGKIFE